jgi:hypothetical protein
MLSFKLIFEMKYSEFSSVSINIFQDYMSNFNEVQKPSNSELNEFVFLCRYELLSTLSEGSM